MPPDTFVLWRPVVQDTSHVLTVAEAGRVLGISYALASGLVRRRVIPSLRLGRRVVEPRTALLSMLDALAGPAESPGT